MSAPPYKVKATYDYTSPHDDDLHFSTGQIITVTEEEDAEWYVGEYTDKDGTTQDGLFPRNFVERYEPEAPPRPARSRPKKEAAPHAEQEPVQPAEEEPSSSKAAPKVEDPPKDTALPKTEQPAPQAPSHVEKAKTPLDVKVSKPASESKAPPPAVAEKPSSFKDRIAAFNKTAAPPVAPKPGGPASGTTAYVKKPFVAPPPARDAYVPPPKEAAPQKIYRREEDPEIAERKAQEAEAAQKAGLAAQEGEEGEEDAPKATSLKDRIALLQKQQQEQAAKRAETGSKPKPKRPPKPQTEASSEAVPRVETDTGATEDPGRRLSEDERPEISRQTSARSATGLTAEPSNQEPVSDGNEADQSGAGETTEDVGGTSTEVDDSDEKKKPPTQSIPPPRTSTTSSRDAPPPPPRAAVASPQEPSSTQPDDEASGDEAGEEEEEEEIDEETRRKMELRERMAKMSGGMGMGNMFGRPGGMPVAGASSRKTKSSGASTDTAAASSPAQAAPAIPIPGMPRMQSPKPEAQSLDADEKAGLATPTLNTRPPEMVEEEEGVVESKPLPSEPPPASSAPRQSQGKPYFYERPYVLSARSLKMLFFSETPISRRSFAASEGSAEEEIFVIRVLKRPLPPPPPARERAPPPPLPGNRPLPPAPETRPVPPPPPQAAEEPSEGSQSEADVPQSPPGSNSRVQADEAKAVPDAPLPISPEQKPGDPRSPHSDHAKKAAKSPTGSAPPVPMSPPLQGDRRTSRAPPVPTESPLMPPPGPPSETRPPPPPPPFTAPPRRESNGPMSPPRDVANDVESDYEGDYDTDIAPNEGHKDALKSHGRDKTSDEGTLSDETRDRVVPMTQAMEPTAPLTTLPTMTRGPPPPPPHQPHASTRRSNDAPRAAPPVPPPREPASATGDDEEYDPYRYNDPQRTAPKKFQTSTDVQQESDPSLYAMSPQYTQERVPPPIPPSDPPRQKHAVPPPLPPQHTDPPLPPQEERQSSEMPRKSFDPPRTSLSGRRSAEQGRGTAPHEGGYIAQDVDLAENSRWWTNPNTPPPAFQSRNDVLCEFEESSAPKRGGRMITSKDVYILFQDYSQTVVTARYDPKDPSASVILEQRHEPPPPKLRQDQLEAAHSKFGAPLSAAAAARANTTVGDATPQGLVLELLRTSCPGALLPIGAGKAYGALVYANMGNATVAQHDEMRAGDVVTFRNARFQGKHGAMHAKYSEDVRAHVAIVVEWDGTKKKVRAWEQGREEDGGRGGSGSKGAKVKQVSFRLGDLRSGEVKIWRVVGRDWVGWE
ncbi:MAG: hypothetical protein M1831_004875 [Alyxoria varia]|nr:MAG: hypothetical protein M1831_004875 [Alyxoria varia]